MKTKITNSSDDDEDDLKTSHLTRLSYSGQKIIFKPSLFKSAIRKVNSFDPEDMSRISLIDKNTEVAKYMVGKPLDDKELQEFVTDTKERSLYAIVGSSFGPQEEINKIQGWVLVYSGVEVTLRAVRALGKQVLESRLPILEISYARYPKALSGRMSGGIEQVLLKIAREDGVKLEKDIANYQRLVAAYIDKENIKSRYVAEAAGFVLQRKKAFWDPRISKKKDLVYLLNWQRLYHKVCEPSCLQAILSADNH